MVTTTDNATTAQINECSQWRERLHAHRDELTALSQQLETISKGQENKELLTDVEHFQNQFYIQQMNFHDINHAIKAHSGRLAAEGNDHPAETIAEHNDLSEKFNQLENTLEDLKNEFSYFQSRY